MGPLSDIPPPSSLSSVVLYTAPWVLPVSSSVIRDGAVAVAEGKILATGSLRSLRARYGGAREECCSGVLLPGLVNAHIHLELSVYSSLSRTPPAGSFCDWIRRLLRARQEEKIGLEEIERAARRTLFQQQEAGVLLLLDTGNILPVSSSDFSRGIEVLALLELLGPTRVAQEQVLARIESLPDAVAATVHALYSTTPGIMTAVKGRSNRLGHVFSLHVAESLDELQLLRRQGGCFPEFLQDRGVSEQELPQFVANNQGAVTYLERLGLLDAQTLCVHCVQVNEEEVRILAERRCKVCLCPGSNRFLGVGIAPLPLMLNHGLLPALGTDSTASNEELDLWREMRILREDHPGVPAEKVLAMATLGGAQALGREKDCGALSPGRKGAFLQVDSPKLQAADDAASVFDILTAGGRPPMIRWISQA